MDGVAMKQLVAKIKRNRDLILFVLPIIIPILFIQKVDEHHDIKWTNFTTPVELPTPNKVDIDTLSVSTVDFDGREKGLLKIYVNANYVSYITGKATWTSDHLLEKCESDLEGFVARCIPDIGGSQSFKIYVWGTFNTFESAMNAGGNIVRLKHNDDEIQIKNDSNDNFQTFLWLLYLLFVIVFSSMKRR